MSLKNPPEPIRVVFYAIIVHATVITVCISLRKVARENNKEFLLKQSLHCLVNNIFIFCFFLLIDLQKQTI